jgi:hypothetical protein
MVATGIPNMKPSMTTDIVAAMSRDIHKRISLQKACPTSNVFRYITAYMAIASRPQRQERREWSRSSPAGDEDDTKVPSSVRVAHADKSGEPGGRTEREEDRRRRTGTRSTR